MARSIWYDKEVNTEKGTLTVKTLFNAKVFSFPKPVGVIERCVEIGGLHDSIILDFFAGSGTTAQAVMELNAKDGGNRKFICVQLPEPIEEGKKEQKEAYDYCEANNLELNIASLTKERIKKAGEKIKKEYPLEFENMDLGFRTYKLADTNFVKWNQSNTENLAGLFSEMEKQVEGKELNPEYVLFETLLKEGIDLALAPEFVELVLGGNNVKSYENGTVIISLDEEIKPELFIELLKLETRPSKVICLESGFLTDEVKINADHLMTKNDIKFKTI
jgi:adenine-specific DNA-methyltransferase